MASVGEVLDHYTLRAFLGRGGMGEVFRAWDARLEREVALKVLSYDEPAARARFLREARAAAGIEHPNIVRIYDVGEAGGVPYIAMELLDGASLRELVGVLGPTTEQRIGWLVEIARGVSAAHARGFVHRDLKPDNVFLTTADEIKVLDFGLARRLRLDGGDVTGPSVTREGTIMGTPLYMAPEQLRGEPLDGRADQFAWGVLAYEVLSGKVPWGDPSDAIALMATMLSRPAPSLAAACPALPAEVAAIVHRALSLERDDRFASMDAVAAALEPFAGDTVRPLRPGSGPRPRRDRDADASGTAETVEAPSLPSASADAPPANADAPTRTAPSPVRRHARVPAAALAALLTAVVLAAVLAARRAPAPPVVAPSQPAPTPSAAVDPELAEARRIWAEESYRRGVEAFRALAERRPDLGSAWLRAALGYAQLGGSGDVDLARGLFLGASRHRATLSPEEVALLDGIEPLFGAEPDLPECRRRLEEAAAAHPSSADVQVYAAQAVKGQDPALALTFASRALALDDHAGFLYGTKALILERLPGRRREAEETLRTCARVLPRNANCVGRLAALSSLGADCSVAARDARAWIAVDPSHATARWLLATAQFSAGEGDVTVREVLTHMDTRLVYATQQGSREWLPVVAALVAGDASALDAALAGYERRYVVASQSAQARAKWASLRVDHLDQTGRHAEAVRLLGETTQRLAALPATPLLRGETVDDLDERPFLVARARAWRAASDQQLAAVLSLATPSGDPYVDWIFTRAIPAATPDAARAALAALPAVESDAGMRDQIEIARLRLLIGDVDGAIETLERGLRRCDRLSAAWFADRAEVELGLLLEQKGDKTRAIEAFSRVAKRWERSRPMPAFAATAARKLVTLRP